jgi:hypothetical protein
MPAFGGKADITATELNFNSAKLLPVAIARQAGSGAPLLLSTFSC